MMLSTPSRWRRCDSISLAGPAPTIPTCVRISLSPLSPLSRSLVQQGRRREETDSGLACPFSAVLTQRRGEVGDEVVGILDADREPHQAVADAESRAHLGRHRAVGHQRGMLDQALDAAEAFGQCKQPAAFEKAAGAVERALEVGPDPAAERAQPPFRQCALGMALTARA